MALGTLFVVATPIGNLEDISPRAIQVLRQADLVLAEDTRVTHKLLMHYEIDTPILSYHQHSSEGRKLEVLRLLLEGKNLGLVTDAGTPGIADPGNELIDFLLGKEPLIKIIPIPGASAVSTALSVCGFNVSQYIFLGFLPKKRSKIQALVAESKFPIVFFESPFRILKTIDLLIAGLGGERRVFVGRELTKIHEEHFRGSLKEVREALSSSNMRGEVVVVVSPPRIELGSKV